MQTYLDLARETGAFKADELYVLEGVLYDYLHFPEEGYVIFDAHVGGRLAGFIVFGRSPLTAYGWDIYWLAVANDCQGNGHGRKLIQKVEEYIQEQMEKAIVRVETSSQNMYAHARNLYTKMGFKQAGVIHDFYCEGDDNIIYYKELPLKQVPA